MTRPMRILFFGDADSVHLQRWAGAMAERGADCHVATRRPGTVPGAASVHVIRPGGASPGWFVALPEVRRLVRRLAPDIVHGHYVTSNGLWAAASGHPRVALTAWGSDILVTPRRNRFWRTLTGWTLRRAGLITADSRDVLTEIEGYGVKAPMHEILWGADTDHFSPPPGPRGEAPPEWLSLRAWEANYQVDRIVQAYAEARRALGPRMGRLHLLGGGSLEADLRSQVQSLQLGGQVLFHGRLDDAGMQAVMRRCAVSVSVPRSDATSVSVLESMACGMALLVSDLPANRQWIDPRGGVIVPADDGPALARSMVDLASRGPAALAAMGAHNRAQALARASRRKQMDKMFSLYQQWLARP